MSSTVYAQYHSYNMRLVNVYFIKMIHDGSDCPIFFHAPFNMVVSGPSQVGKTTFVKRLLSRRTCTPGSISPSFDRVIYVYGEEQPGLREQLPIGTELQKGWSTAMLDDISPNQNNVLVLDDVTSDCKDDPSISNLFTRGGHHRNISIILLTQNYFFGGRSALDIRRNTHYLILFACKQDNRQISAFAQRVFPAKWRNMLAAYEDETATPRGHLLIDMTTQCPQKYMIRSKVLTDNPVVFVI